MRRLTRSGMSQSLLLLALLTFWPKAGWSFSPGDLDGSFGTAGKVVTDLPGHGTNEDAGSLLIQPDGKIVAAGGAAPDDFALVRYNSDGSLDPSFGSGGVVTTDFPGQDGATALIRQPDGKLVAAGIAGGGDFALARYNSDGTLDTSFGTGGRVTTAFGVCCGTDWPTALVLQPDGKLVASGAVNTVSDFGLARYHADGALDTSFGTGGRVVTDFGGFDQAYDLILQPDGKLVAGGAAAGRFALARYNPDGTLDASFGAAGVVTTDLPGDFEAVNALVRLPDGKLVVAGSASPSGSSDFVVARYNGDGTLDTSFGTGGFTTTDFSGGIDFASSLVLRSDGKLVVAGGISFDFGLARYDADGALDASFGTGGFVTTDFAVDSDSALALVAQSDGRLVAAGLVSTDGWIAFGLARYLGDPGKVAGNKLLFKDNADTTKRKITFLSKDPTLDTTVGSGIDPITDGASLQIWNPTTSESVCLALPSVGGSWQTSGSPPNVGYKYKDRLFANGPCKAAVVKDAKLLKVTCKASSQPIAYSLDEASQGSVAVQFTSGVTSYCALFGGTIARDSGTDPPNLGGKGQFNAKDASAPAQCPVPPSPCP